MTAIPAPWMRLMDKVGIASIRQLANAAGFQSNTTVNNIVMKGTQASEENMQKIASALKVPVEELYGITSGVASRPLTLPLGTEKLSPRQKEAVAEIIRLMVEEKENAQEFVYKKSAEPAEQAQEKSGSVTPIRGRRTLTPAQQRFEDTGRKVAKTKRDFTQDSPKITPASPHTDE
ncbi:transcriptional regulator with XRE-family HTH domain [Arthrobacter bambusae]|nr:transcriptional regulator with XRE-family HTH domain [Arthrobacter bambusae]